MTCSCQLQNLYEAVETDGFCGSVKTQEMEKRSFHMPGSETEGGKLAAQQAMHSQYVLQLLQLQRRAGFLCDITVNIQEKSFKAHKPLLAACSLYFRALFADSESAKTSTLNFEKLSANGFEVLLDYIYSGSLAITSENSEQVLHAANCLQMTNVVETCLNFVRSSFKVTAGHDATEMPPQLPGPNEIQTGAQSAESPRNLVHTAHAIPTAFQPLGGSAPMNQVGIAPRQHSIQNPHDVQGNLAMNTTHHHADSTTALQGSSLNHVPQTRVSTVSPCTDVEQMPSPQYSLMSPSSETLSALMPYLVAKNARRPTLHEVRRLLLSGQKHNPNAGVVALEKEENQVVATNQPPPALIPVSEASKQKASFCHYVPGNEINTAGQFQTGMTSSTDGQAPLNTMVSRTIHSSSALPSADGNTANHATVHAVRSFDLHNAQLTSNVLHPFVLLTSEDNVLVRKNSRPAGDSSKGNAWSDDRSVESDQTHDRKDTHLSGTPCSASLTRDNSAVPCPYQASSPASFGSTPSIEISPESVKMVDSPTELPSVPKLRWLRAQSLDLSKPMTVNELVNCTATKGTEDIFRSASLSPRFFSDRNNNNNNNLTVFKCPQPSTKGSSLVLVDHSAVISPELAANAVGALFATPGLEKSSNSTLSATELSSVNENMERGEDLKLVVETPDTSDSAPENRAEKSEIQSEQKIFVTTKSDKYAPSKGRDGVFEKRELNYIARTSPPPEEALFTIEQENDMSRFTSPNVPTVGTVDENGVLDLSIQKPSRISVDVSNVVTAPSTKQHIHNHAGIAPTQDPKAREALDALVMMRGTTTQVVAASVCPPTDSVFDDVSSSTAGYSRKPRRSSGGQICQWPGCGRLFRHRNIFEEHVKLHKLGVPVKQLRRCYMGARVKKTARERLDEMRMTEGAAPTTSPQSAEVYKMVGASALNSKHDSNRRKRASSSRLKGVDHERVAVNNVNEHGSASLPPWPQQRGSSHAMVRHSHAPSIPLAVLQAVSSNSDGSLLQQWPGMQSMPMNLVHYTSSGQILQPNMPGAAPIFAVASGAKQPQEAIGATNPAVVETLAALGIPIPENRGNVERSVAQLLPTTQDQLKRTIAASENESEGATVLSRPLQPNLNTVTEHVQQRNGNVAGADARVGSSYCNVSSSSCIAPSNLVPVSNHAPVPNQYHGTLHGSTCS